MRPLRNTAVTAAAILLCGSLALAQAPFQGPYNVVLIVVDDIGVDQVGCYLDNYENLEPESDSEACDNENWPEYPQPCTPNIDCLAAEGVRFTNAWSNPICSPTRAQIMTGRTAFRNGIGTVMNPAYPEKPGLDPSLAILPKLTKFDAAVGKWHLGNHQDQWPGHPLDVGFGPVPPRTGFSGTFYNMPAYSDTVEFGEVYVNYYLSDGTDHGSKPLVYATAQTTNDAITYMGELNAAAASEPWLLYVAYHASHTPMHCPQDVGQTCPPIDHKCAGGISSCSENWCDTCVNPESDPDGDCMVDETRAMTQLLDSYIGQLVAEADRHPNTVVMLIGDNGTVKNGSVLPFAKFHAKNTLFQGGINVPLIIRMPPGHGPEGQQCDELASATDLLATTAAFLGKDLSQHGAFPESFSLAGYATGNPPPEQDRRPYAYSEAFGPRTYVPVGDGPPAGYEADTHRRAVRDDKFKLVERRTTGGVTQKFFCLYRPDLTGNPTPHDPAILDDGPMTDPDSLISAFERRDLLTYPVETWPTGACESLYDLRRKLLDDYPALPIKRWVEIQPTITRRARLGEAPPSPPNPSSTIAECDEDLIRISNPPPVFERVFMQFPIPSALHGKEILEVDLLVDVTGAAYDPATVVAVWPIDPSQDVKDYRMEENECHDLLHSLTGSPYAEAGDWVRESGFIKTIALGNGILQNIEDEAALPDPDDAFSLALALPNVPGTPYDAITLANAPGMHRLRIRYRDSDIGGGMAFAPSTVHQTTLKPNRPNPFNPTTTIDYSVRRTGQVTLNVYDVAGRLVRSLVNETQSADSYSVVWDGRDGNGNAVTSGVYFYRLVAGDDIETGKMVLLK